MLTFRESGIFLFATFPYVGNCFKMTSEGYIKKKYSEIQTRSHTGYEFVKFYGTINGRNDTLLPIYLVLPYH